MILELYLLTIKIQWYLWLIIFQRQTTSNKNFALFDDQTMSSEILSFNYISKLWVLAQKHYMNHLN